MTNDEAWFDRIGRALEEDIPAEPPADRIAALRARATSGAPAIEPEPEVLTAIPTRAAHRARRWPLIAAAAAVALVAGAGVARLASTGDGDQVAGEVEFDGAMTGPDGDALDAELTVVGTGIGRVIDLHTAELPILPKGEYYQVWFVGPGDEPGAPNRISAGTFHPDPGGRSDVRFAAAVDPALYPVVEITAEPGDGDPNPSGPVVLRADIDA